MTPTQAQATPHAEQLEKLLGLKTVTYKINLSKEELFHEAIAHDRGRVAKDGPSDAQKAYPTKLGVKGPLVYYTDPGATGRRVKDTFAVGWYKSTWTQNKIQLFDMPSNTPLWTFLSTEATGEYQEIPSDLALTPDGSHLLVGSWGDQNNQNPEVHLFAREAATPIHKEPTR